MGGELMAKVGKSKTAKKKTTAKVVIAKPVAAKATAALEKKTTKATKGRKEVAQPTVAASAETPAKKVSQKLIETIEKRRQAQGKAPGALFARPAGRRGRRPKGAVEYTPEHQEEDVLTVDADAEGLEYDTGIRVKQQREEGFSLDRFEDFDEELNFDW